MARCTTPEQQREYTRRWHAKNRARVANLHAARRAREKEAFVEHVDLLTLWSVSGGRCGICGEPVAFEEATLDHIIPIARGGEHSMSNCQPAHSLCNFKKGARCGIMV